MKNPNLSKGFILVQTVKRIKHSENPVFRYTLQSADEQMMLSSMYLAGGPKMDTLLSQNRLMSSDPVIDYNVSKPREVDFFEPADQTLISFWSKNPLG